MQIMLPFLQVSIGLRRGSPSEAEARACGFTEEAGTLGEVFDVIGRADFIILLISDGAQVRHMRPALVCAACARACSYPGRRV